MDLKLTMLYVLIGTIIGLSYHGDENLAKVKRELSGHVGAMGGLKS
jgi:hypothetical protein